MNVKKPDFVVSKYYVAVILYVVWSWVLFDWLRVLGLVNIL